MHVDTRAPHVGAEDISARAPAAGPSRLMTAEEWVAERRAREEGERLRLDYQVTVDTIKTLTDIRFRCLTFVTAVTAIANALLSANAVGAARFPFALVGFCATLGIVVYELRNSQLYEAAAHRAKVLEGRLSMATTTDLSTDGGLFNERVPYVEEGTELTHAELREAVRGGRVASFTYLGVVVKHDIGLALIYGAALASWVFLAIYGLLSLPAVLFTLPSGVILATSVLLSLLAAALAIREFVRHDSRRYKLADLADIRKAKARDMPAATR